MTNPKIQKAIEIFKNTLTEAKGKFGARLSQMNSNEVEITCDGILYATVNVRTGGVKI